MESWQLFPRHLDTIHHLSKRGIVAHQINPRRLFFHPSRCVLCLNSRCFNISFCELILYSLIFEKINPSSVSFRRHRVDEDLKSEDVKINVMQQINKVMRCNLDREDCVGLVPPLSSYLTSWILGRDSCLVGVSCHSPRICLSLVALRHSCHHV